MKQAGKLILREIKSKRKVKVDQQQLILSEDNKEHTTAEGLLHLEDG